MAIQKFTDYRVIVTKSLLQKLSIAAWFLAVFMPVFALTMAVVEVDSEPAAIFRNRFPRVTVERKANRWKSAKKMVIFTISCCHGNSLGYAHMNEKILGLLLIFTANARSLNPKHAKFSQIVHFQLFVFV